jgi:hypothetical protein
MSSIRTSPRLLGAIILVATTACVTGSRPNVGTSSDLGPANRSVVTLGPADFAVRNQSGCHARVMSVDAVTKGATPVILAEVAPHQRTVVTVPAGRRLDIMTFTEPNATPDVPGRDCRASGTVTWERVASQAERQGE